MDQGVLGHRGALLHDAPGDLRQDRDGLTLDVAMALSSAKVKTTNLSARSMPDGYATVHIVLEVKDRRSSLPSSTS